MTEGDEQAETPELRHIDMSSEERLIKYSRDIQKYTKQWLDENVGQLFPSLKEAAMECANTMFFGTKGKSGSHPSWKTVQSHIEQYTVPNESWEIIEQTSGITFTRRPAPSTRFPENPDL